MALPTASDNQFPKVILEEVANDGSATVTPNADHRALFLGEDGALHLKDSAAAVTDIGGGGWTLHLNLDGTTLTGLTGVNGTWASNGTVIQQTDGTSASRHAKVTAAVPGGVPLIFQTEVRMPTAGQSTNANMTAGIYLFDSGSDGGGIATGIRFDNGATNPRLITDVDGVSSLASQSETLAYDTWYTLRCVAMAGTVSVYLAGTLEYTTGATPNGWDVGLWTAFGAKADFRNIKVWTLTQP